MQLGARPRSPVGRSPTSGARVRSPVPRSAEPDLISNSGQAHYVRARSDHITASPCVQHLLGPGDTSKPVPTFDEARRVKKPPPGGSFGEKNYAVALGPAPLTVPQPGPDRSDAARGDMAERSAARVHVGVTSHDDQRVPRPSKDAPLMQTKGRRAA